MGFKLLVIDDEKDLLDFLTRVLTDAGYEVRTAVNGPEGLTLAQQDPPDLVLLDIMMPRMDGWEVLRILKSLPRVSHIPVVMLTAKADPQSRWDGWQEGAVDYITKPFTLEDLKLRLDEILAQVGEKRE